MIDLHCHILPALDDGALDVDDSVAMARQADAVGITRICATPHIRDDHAVVVAELRPRVDRLNEALEWAGVHARVLAGGEVAERRVYELTNGELGLVSLGGGGRWTLLEPAPGPLSESLVQVVNALARRGFRAVIAHPERHLGPDAPELLARLVARGALVQATAASLAAAGAEFLLALAARGLIHVVASDAHSSHGGRPVRVSDGLAALAAIPELNPHLAWIANTAPEAIVEGDEVDPPFAVR